MRWVVFDIDGTLADIQHRLHHIQKDKPDWDAFNKECLHDYPKKHIVHLAQVVRREGFKIAVISGRDAAYSPLTEQWLREVGIPYEKLLLRPSGDHRSDTVVKQELFNAHLNVDDVWFVIEDRDKVVNMWREMGLTCLQCQAGDY